LPITRLSVFPIPRFIRGLVLGAACVATAGCPSGCDEITKILNPTGTSVQSVTVTPLAAQVAVGETKQFAAVVLPTGVSDRSVTWAVQPSNIAKIDANGVLTGLAAGQAVVTATSVATPVHTAEAAATVTTPSDK
jgi:uncharacterized protein YjdB